MSALFEELAFHATPMGELTLRRRRILSLDLDVLEVKLGDEFLMSSLFTVGERALARLGLAAHPGAALDVLVGGLGLGCTADAALDDPRVATLTVIDALEPVIAWHQQGLVPLGARLTADPRCALQRDDFFAYVGADQADGRLFDVILLDIDHSPRALLDARHGGFYTTQGLGDLARRLRPGGVFAMWSDAAPDAAFSAVLAGVFETHHAEVVRFDNPLQDRQASCTIYVARTAS